MKKKHIWDLRFLTLAKTVSTWSKDPSTKVGAVIVDKNRRVVSLGYNGFPNVC
jgi:dCMP deaminase